jgi:hypothetical protein
VHRIFETQVRVWIVSKSHAHEHAIQNSRKSFNYEIETLLVCLEKLLFQLVFQFGAAVELAVLRRVQVFRDHIACQIFLLFTWLGIDLGPAVLLVNQAYYTLKLEFSGYRHPLTIIVRKQIKH